MNVINAHFCTKHSWNIGRNGACPMCEDIDHTTYRKKIAQEIREKLAEDVLEPIWNLYITDRDTRELAISLWQSFWKEYGL